jgi:hypothetical protein
MNRGEKRKEHKHPANCKEWHIIKAIIWERQRFAEA